MKSKFKLSLVLMVLFLARTSYAQNWLWSKQMGGNKWDVDGAICIDNSGNTYHLIRYKSDTCITGNDTILRYDFNAYGSTSGFAFVKYDTNGNKQWVLSNDGSVNNNIHGQISNIAFDKINNCFYAIGGFRESGKIGGFSISDSTYAYSILYAKFDMNGNCLWAKKAGTFCTTNGCNQCSSEGWLITVDDYGDIIIGGSNECAALFDSISVPEGSFMAKFDPNGIFIWARKLFNENGSSLYRYDAKFWKIVTKGRDIFAFGNCAGNPFVLDTFHVVPRVQDIYLIASFDSTGAVKWVKTCAGSDYDAVASIAVDDSSNSYISGSLRGDAIFDNDTITSPVNNISNNLFLAKYNKAGQFLWVRQTNSATSYIRGDALAIGGDGKVYLAGSFCGTLSLGNYTINSYSSLTGPSLDLFITKFDASGNCIGLNSPIKNVFPRKICLDVNNSIYFAGSFIDTATFGSNPLISYGSEDAFMAKLDGVTTGENESRLSSGNNNQLLIYANPNKGICNVTVPDEFLNERNLVLKIIDHSGRLVQEIPVQMHEGKISLNIEAEAKGIYNATLTNGQKFYYGKIVFE